MTKKTDGKKPRKSKKSKKSRKSRKPKKSKKPMKPKKSVDGDQVSQSVNSASDAKSISGKLAKKDFGYSMPVDAPLYHRPPVEYKDSTILTYNYVTDPDAAASLLPAQLSLGEVAKVKVVFANYPWSSVGFYNEVVQAIECTYNGKPYVYAVRLHVTSDRAMVSGREIGGFPKKMGHIEFQSGAEYLSYLESPIGMRVCTGAMVAKSFLKDVNDVEDINYVSLKLMPGLENDGPPAVCELLSTVWKLGPGKIWMGEGSVHFDSKSELDPYHRLPIKTPLFSTIYRGDMTVDKIELLERF